MPLTWQDVAGRVQAPDYSGISEMITKGVEGLGAAVANVLGGPEQRRQAQLAREIMSLKGQSEAHARSADSIDALGTDIRNRQKEKDVKEFGAAQSILEAAAADAAMQGKSFDDFMKTDTYAKLSEGAKAYGASHLSDAFYRGQQSREQRLAREQNDRMQEAQLSLQRQNLAESRAARAEASRSRKIAEETAQLRLDAMKRDEANIKFLNTPLGRLTMRVGTNYNDVTGRAYEDTSWGDLAKKSGVEGFSEYRESLNALNAQRQRQGKRALPEGAAKALIATQIGKNSGVPSWFNEIDQSDIDNQLTLLADQYDATLREADVLTRFKDKQDKGISFTDEDVLAELAKANPGVQGKKPATPTVPSSLMDTWNMSHK